MTGLAPLILIILAVGLMFGLVKPRRIGSYLIGLVVTPVLIAIAATTTRSLYSSLSLGEKLILLASIPLILLVVTLYLLPAHVRASVIGDFVYDMLKLIVLSPFRLLGWIYTRSLGRNR